jgi:hypothetical protein
MMIIIESWVNKREPRLHQDNNAPAAKCMSCRDEQEVNGDEGVALPAVSQQQYLWLLLDLPSKHCVIFTREGS